MLALSENPKGKQIIKPAFDIEVTVSTEVYIQLISNSRQSILSR